MNKVFKLFLLNLRNRRSKGSALLIAIFISVIAAMLVSSMSNISASNSKQLSYDRDGRSSYYAAEAGVADVMDFFNSDPTVWGATLENSDLPDVSIPDSLLNGATYWVDAISYTNGNANVVVDVVGSHNGAFRKIRTNIAKADTPSIFDAYGLLSKGKITVNGKKSLEMSVHGNQGIDFSGTTTFSNNAVATQSSDASAGAPNSATNPVGGYVATVAVPAVPIADYKIKGKSDNILLTISQAGLMTRINDAPAGSNIYISGSSLSDTLTLSGDMQGKFIFVDGDINISASGASDLSNVTVVSSGVLGVNGSGSIDVASSHAGKIDVIFAADQDVTLNGSRKFSSIFWTNRNFTQNGSSVAGRVIAQDDITFNGNFTLSASDAVYSTEASEYVASISSWQQVSMDQ